MKTNNIIKMSEEPHSPKKYNFRKKAIFLNDFESENPYVCCICSEELPNDSTIGLSCNPNKHTFCKECITDWYSIIKKNKYMNSNYDKPRMCPVCREDGGLIPHSDQSGFIRGIHYIMPVKKMKKSKSFEEIDNINNKKQKSTEEKQQKSTDENKNTTEEKQINDEKQLNEENESEKKLCGHPLKRKNCFCKNSGKNIYGGSCKLHYNHNIIII